MAFPNFLFIFSNSKIINLGNLKVIDDDADFSGSLIEDLGKLEKGKIDKPKLLIEGLKNLGLNPDYFLTGKGSPELLPATEDGNIAQITEDLVGPYELHDFFLYYTLRCGFSPAKIEYLAQRTFADKYDDATINHWLRTFCRRFFNQQFKRSCMPDGPKVGSVCLSPRGDWRMPSDASSRSWQNQCAK